MRGGKFAVVEENWKPKRLVVLRFPDRAAAQSLYNDPDYAPLKAVRRRASETEIVIVEGV